jgi:hypothetical protein
VVLGFGSTALRSEGRNEKACRVGTGDNMWRCVQNLRELHVKHDCIKEQTFTSDKEADLEHTYKDTTILMSVLEQLSVSSMQSVQLTEMRVTFKSMHRTGRVETNFRKKGGRT